MRRRPVKIAPRISDPEPPGVVKAKARLNTAFRMFDDAPSKENHDRLVRAQRAYLEERELNRAKV